MAAEWPKIVLAISPSAKRELEIHQETHMKKGAGLLFCFSDLLFASFLPA